MKINRNQANQWLLPWGVAAGAIGMLTLMGGGIGRGETGGGAGVIGTTRGGVVTGVGAAGVTESMEFIAIVGGGKARSGVADPGVGLGGKLIPVRPGGMVGVGDDGVTVPTSDVAELKAALISCGVMRLRDKIFSISVLVVPNCNWALIKLAISCVVII